MRMSRWKVLAGAAVVVIAAACTGTDAEPEDASSSDSEDTADSDDSEDSGDAADEGDGGEAVTLKWLIEEPENAEALQAIEDHIAGFEGSSGIDIEVSTLPWEDMRTILQTQLRSGEGPDVFNWGSGPSWGGALAEAGFLYDLTDAYDEFGWEVYDSAVERVTVDGRIYGIPGEMETIGIFYNEEIFDDLGIEAPESLDDLRDVSATIRDAGIVPLAVSDQAGWEGGHLLSVGLSSRIASAGMEALFNGESSWDSPEVVETLAVWEEFHEAGYLPDSPTAVDYDTAISMFFAGEAAMIPTGSWLVGEIETNTDFPVGYIPFPAPDGPGIFAGGLGSGPFIAADTEHPDEALQFLDFLASNEHTIWTIENLGSIPPIPVDTDDVEVSVLLEQVLDDVAGLSSGGDFGYNIDVMTTDTFNQAMYDGMQAIFTDQMTPQEVAESLAAAADAG